MSAVQTAGALRRVPGQWREASLRLVPTPGRRAPRAAFVALVVAILGTGLIGMLVLTTSMQQSAFALFDAQAEISDLRQERQTLAAELAAREAPASLAKAATLAGMVPNDTPAFLDLDAGAIRGELVPAPARPGGSR
jgi:hypothetical protein